MEVNKEQAERCRDVGAAAMKQGDFPRAIKFLQKSLQLYPLPGVDALLSSAKTQMASSANNSSSSTTGNTGTSQHSNSTDSRPSQSTSEQNLNGANGRAYSEEQVKIVEEVLRSKEGGRGAHYRVLKLSQGCSEAEIKKAYRKLSLKVHPDKNSAPNADEAFKAVGLAYATLSDPQKRTIYDRYGDEDPDNRGAARGGGMNMHHRGQEVSPEEIFNMFFGGGMPGMHRGGPGFHVYTSGFGPGGMPFRNAGPRRQARPQEREERQASFLSALFQFMPLLLILFSTFFRSDGSSSASMSGRMPGEGQHFNLVRKPPFVNLMKTQTTKVRDIPFYVTTNFARTYAQNNYQLRRVEQMVEVAYEQYLIEECTKQRNYKKRLQLNANTLKMASEEEKARKIKQADEFELSRCLELGDLYPHRKVEL
ncbi:DnaJ homolog subfamily B member 12 [Fistulifera solaris]|uniref:DnaJ homolog subfamily B member 12 n=1 Tax=Fistulifera solaris TaxID=1519565 RepID=A0A1Z5JNK6_FISSO|nr:DnaJ homolog subfamily B member 12 [Fistulifera solaris]|eukprot:GAX15361.1 DnaJ homolog subfamily B member 12 [Fistulifera solaris]